MHTFLSILTSLGVFAAWVIAALLAAYFLGIIAGRFKAGREYGLKSRTYKEAKARGEEFLIITGEKGMVEELARVCIATSERFQQIANANKEDGIEVTTNGSEQPTTEA